MNDFTVDFVCPVGYEYLAAEICFKQQIICRINCERSDGEPVAEFFSIYREPLKPVELPVSDLMKLIQEVLAELRDLRLKQKFQDEDHNGN